jgi:hypothetical protein
MDPDKSVEDPDSLSVPAEPVTRSRIRVGAGGPLIVPRENLGLDDSSDLDFGEFQPAPIRKPGRLEWFALKPDRCLETRLLPVASGPNGMDREWFYVAPEIRGPIREEIRDCLVYPYFSELHHGLYLWIIVVTEGNPWYESLRPVIEQAAGFYGSHLIRIISNRIAGKYRRKQKPADVAALYQWPDRPTAEFLGEALGEDHFISSVNHPTYRALVEGTDLD